MIYYYYYYYILEVEVDLGRASKQSYKDMEPIFYVNKSVFVSFFLQGDVPAPFLQQRLCIHASTPLCPLKLELKFGLGKEENKVDSLSSHGTLWRDSF